MTRTKWREEHSLVTTKNEELKKQLDASNLKIQELESLNTKNQEKISELESTFASKKSEWESKETQLENDLANAKKEVKDKQDQINQMELKRMASAYATQEKGYDSDVKEWRKYLFLSAILLVLSTFFSIIYASGKPWYDRFEVYLIDFIIISAVWFTTSQYSYFSKLRNDFANRKTLAQTYHNILLSITESSSDIEKGINEETKRLFMTKATDVLCAPSMLETKEPILSKELFKNAGKVAEIIVKSK